MNYFFSSLYDQSNKLPMLKFQFLGLLFVAAVFVYDSAANAWSFNYYIFLLQLAFECEEAYYQALGYRVIDRKLESTKDYLTRLASYMELYGALIQVCNYDLMVLNFEVLKFFIFSNWKFIKPQLYWHGTIVHLSFVSSFLKEKAFYQEWLFWQTEVQGVQNTHGLKEGWAWIARFLNTLPANRYTAVALSAFLKVSW